MQAKNGRPQLHASALNMKCAEAFRRRYMENEVIPPGVAMIVGTATDKSVTKNLAHKINTKELLSIEEVSDAARDGLNDAWQGGVTLDFEEAAQGVKVVKGGATDKAVRLAVLHAKRKAPALNPTHVQRQWSVELKGFPVDLVGTMDIQEGAESIRDTKTSGKTPSDDVAQRSVQLKAYALAAKVIDGEAPKKVFLDYLIDTQSPSVKSIEHEPGDADFRALLRRVETLCMAMERGVFVPVEPDHWVCSVKWCGYYRTCKYVRQPKQFAA